jgi:D-aminopeptidase
MSALGFKGGIGTASRVTPATSGGWTVGVLVLANFGRADQLTIDGVPVGRLLREERESPPERGSIMFVVATDAPLLDRGLQRLARRCAHGLARTGATSGHGSGDYVIAFSTTPELRMPHEPANLTRRVELAYETSVTMDPLFQATVEATEEAIINALFRATTVVGRDDHVRVAMPLERVLPLLRKYGRLTA